MNLSSNADFIPSKIKTNPFPPESTTPTSFKIGNKLGVFFKDLLAAFTTTSKILFIVVFDVIFNLLNSSYVSLITVKIVPSTGFKTDS